MMSTFSISKRYEVWQRPKTFWSFSYRKVFRIKLYGYQYTRKHNIFYVYMKQEFGSLNSNKTQIKKQWVQAFPNYFDKDKSFIIETALNFRKQKVRKKLDELKSQLKKLPNRIEDLELILSKISIDKFDWSLHPNIRTGQKASELPTKPLIISDEIKDKADGTFYSFPN